MGRKLRCLVGRHDWHLVETDSTCHWADFITPCYIHLTFYRCAHCGKRRATASKSIKGVVSKHSGAVTRMARWEIAGHLPSMDGAQGKPKGSLTVFPGGKGAG